MCPQRGGGWLRPRRREVPIWSLRASSLRARFGTAAPAKGHTVRLEAIISLGLAPSPQAHQGPSSLWGSLRHPPCPTPTPSAMNTTGPQDTSGSAGGFKKRIPGLRNRKIVELSPLNPPPISEMGRLRFGGEFQPKITQNTSSPPLTTFFTSQHWRCVQGPRGQRRCRGHHFLLSQHLCQNLGLSPLTVTPGPGGVGLWEVSLQFPRPLPSPSIPQCPRAGLTSLLSTWQS